MKVDELYLDQTLPADLNQELLTMSRNLTNAVEELKQSCIEYAKAEHAYKHAKALAYLNYKGTIEKATIPHLDALVDKAVSEERERAYLARAMKEATLESVRSLRAQINALQTIAAGMRTEMVMAGGPEPRWGEGAEKF